MFLSTSSGTLVVILVHVGNIRYGGNDLLIVSCSGKEKKTRERRSGKENKRKQGCDSVSLACASPDYCVRTPVRPSGAGTSRTGTSRIKCGHKHAFSNTPTASKVSLPDEAHM